MVCNRGSKPKNHETFIKQQKGSAEMSQWVNQTEEKDGGQKSGQKKGEAWMESRVEKIN